MSRETASNTLISTMKAFNIDADQANNTISKYNQVANNFAIDTEGLAEGVSRSGSALKAAGNTLDQSLAMMVAGNDAVQNPQTVGR